MSLRSFADRVWWDNFDPAEHAAAMAYIDEHGHERGYDSAGCKVCRPPVATLAGVPAQMRAA